MAAPHPATDALRAQSPELLHERLVATLAQGEEEWVKDWRDLLVSIAPFHHCAAQLGLDVADTFRAAAEAGPASVRHIVAEFGARDDVTPAAFGFKLVEETEGPAYRFSPGP